MCVGNYSKKSTRRLRGPRGACGKDDHGKRVEGSSVRVCFACDRSKDDATALSSQPWRHIGDGPYWAGLTDWAHSVEGFWPHERNMLEKPLQAEECVCSRTDCASNMYMLFLDRKRKLVEGTRSRLEIGQPSPAGAFPYIICAGQLVYRVQTPAVARHLSFMFQAVVG